MYGWWKSKKIQKENAHRLHNACVEKSRNPLFYKELGVPDTVEGRFEMLCLHASFIIEALYSMGRPTLAQALFDVMFKDMDRNMREAGVGDLAVPRRMKAMMKDFKGRSFAYREAVLSGRVKEAVTRNIGIEDELAKRQLSVYIIQSYAHVKKKDFDFFSGLIDNPHTLFLTHDEIVGLIHEQDKQHRSAA